jgi:hypothetical protein
MTLYSPLEDLMHRTVSSVDGMWSKLEYLADLREEGTGDYEHWGLARTFGQESARRAMEQAHRNVLLQILHTPLSVLMEEARTSAHSQALALNVYVQQLQTNEKRLVPERLGGGSAKHFSSILLALSCLAACPPLDKVPTLQVS